MTDEQKNIILDGVETLFAGSSGDPYFQHLEYHGKGLNGLADLVKAHIPSDSVVLDVGANIGLSTILLARLVAKVIAFEPSPTNLALLRKNLELNAIANVDVIAAAVSAEPATLLFHEATYGAGSHVVTPGHLDAANVRTVDVPALPLDSQTLPPIAFIKMDTEGHEPDVLAGARTLLERDKPLIFMEINVWCLTAFAGHSPGAFIRTLWNRFEVGSVVEGGRISPLNDPYSFLHETIVHGGGMADVVLRPRFGIRMPTLPELAWPEAAVFAISQSGNRRILTGEVTVSEMSRYWNLSGWIREPEHLVLAGRASMVVPFPSGTNALKLRIVSHRTKPLEFTISREGETIVQVMLESGTSYIELDRAISGAQLDFRAEQWIPADEIGNEDHRSISLHLAGATFD